VIETAVSRALVDLYERMALVREFEQRVSRLYRDNQIPGFIHTSLGQEAVAVGVCAALRPDDYLVTTHRGHGHVLAKGADPEAAMAELFGKATGLCKGKGGSMHIADARLGILGANAIVGASIPLATGAALSSKQLGLDRVAVAFFGDGAVNQGSFHEGVNLATIWKLPVLFVCENNTYAEFTDSRTMSRRESVVAAAEALGCPGTAVDGNDVEAVAAAASEAVQRCRRGDGPALLEATTYRWMGHYEGDPQTYKPEDEVAAWKARDPLLVARGRILERQLASDAELDAISAETVERIDRAERFARESPYPDLDQIWTDVYGD
jgi:pyruvate dehydrogenase E1 component alpha subunit